MWESLFKRIFSGRDFYIALGSLALALTLHIFTTCAIPWYLLWLYLFLVMVFLRYLWDKLQCYLYKREQAMESQKKAETKKQLHDTYVTRAYTGMELHAKYYVLEAIKNNPISDYENVRVIRDNKQCFLRGYVEPGPYIIDLGRDSIQLVDVNHQQGYIIVTIDPLFYKLLNDNAKEIMEQVSVKMPNLLPRTS